MKSRAMRWQVFYTTEKKGVGQLIKTNLYKDSEEKIYNCEDVF